MIALRGNQDNGFAGRNGAYPMNDEHIIKPVAIHHRGRQAFDLALREAGIMIKMKLFYRFSAGCRAAVADKTRQRANVTPSRGGKGGDGGVRIERCVG
jgi:hypothetical protein